MTFNPAKSFVEIAGIVAKFNELASLLEPKNGNGRWNKLQEWLNRNPDKKHLIEKVSKLDAKKGFEYLIGELGIDLNILRPFDPCGEIETKAHSAIAELQKLYNERKTFGPDGRKLNSPGAKRKKKVLESKNIQYVDGEIIEETKQ